MGEKKEKKGSGCMTFVVTVVVTFFVMTWLLSSGTAKEANEIDVKSKNIGSSQTSSTAGTAETILPGSAAEAVQNGTLTMADIQHRADALGWSTTAWQEWYYIANKTGTTMEAIEEAAAELNRRLAAAEPELYEAMETIGISISDAKAMKPEDLFEKVMYGLMSTVSVTESITEAIDPTETTVQTEALTEATTEVTMEPTTEPETTAATTEPMEEFFIANKNTKKYHHTWCSYAPDENSKNYLLTNMTRGNMDKMGYEPCKRCMNSIQVVTEATASAETENTLAKAPDKYNDTFVCLADKTTKIYHNPWCEYAPEFGTSNCYSGPMTAQQLEDEGYKPCAKCIW